jgi:hypothetical protein
LFGPRTSEPKEPRCALVVPDRTGLGSSDAGGTVGELLAAEDVLVAVDATAVKLCSSPPGVPSSRLNLMRFGAGTADAPTTRASRTKR